jgi:hypothetical protein
LIHGDELVASLYHRNLAGKENENTGSIIALGNNDIARVALNKSGSVENLIEMFL